MKDDGDWQNDTDMGNWCTLSKTCSTVTSSTRNSTWTGLGLNPDVCHKMMMQPGISAMAWFGGRLDINW